MKKYSPRSKLIQLRGNLSQSKIATVFGVKQQTYSHWEVGRSTPPAAIMKQMEDYFGVSMEELFPDIFNSKNLLKEPTMPKSPTPAA